MKVFPQTHSIPLLRGRVHLKPCKVRRCLYRRMTWLAKRLDEPNSEASHLMLLEELIATAMVLEAFDLERHLERHANHGTSE